MMAGGKIRGITIEIGGDTTKLGKAIESNEKQTRSLQTELKQVEKLLKLDPHNVELLAQKQKILTGEVKETSDKLEVLKEAQSQVVEQFEKGEIGEDQLRAFQREIIETEKKLEDLIEKLNETEEEIDDVGDKADDSGEGFTIMKGALGDLVSNVISSAVSAIGDLVGSLFELTEATEEYRAMQSKLEGSADSFGYSAEFATDKYKEFYKYLGDDQMATNAITNLMGLGTSTESVSKLAEGAIGVWASYGDSIPIEGLTEAINETIQCGKVTGGFADTINWCSDANEQLNAALGGNSEAQKAFNDAIKDGETSEDAFNAALSKVTDEQERADIVAQFLNSTYGESKTAYDETAKSILDQNEAELKLKETQAQLGETMSPINAAFTEMKNQALEAITPLVQSLADAFMNLYNWLQQNPVVMTIVTAVVIALAAAFAVLAGALAIQGLINGVKIAFSALNKTILANPIVLLVAAIAALVAAFIYLWNNCEAFRNFWINLWNQIKIITSTVVTGIVNGFKTAWTAIKTAWSAAGTFFTNIWTGIKNAFGAVKTWFSDTFQGAWQAIKNVFSGWGSFFGGLWSTIKSKFSALGSNIASAIGSAVKSGINGVISTIEKTINKAVSLINGAIGLINMIPGVSVGKISPVKLPRLAMGGIVDRPTIAEIGENGREAVIPLEKNTEWINDLATKISSQMGAPGLSSVEVLAKLEEIGNRIANLKIVLDSGTLVGETIDQIDAGLAANQRLKVRGI